MNWQELSDQRLIELCLEANADAWVELLRRYKRLIAKTSARTLRILGTAPTASLLEDRISDCLIRILDKDCRALRELKWLHGGSLRGLLQKSAITATQDWIRKEHSQKRDKDKEVPLPDEDHALSSSYNVATSVNHKILLEQLAKCLEQLIRDEPDCIRDLAIFRLFYGSRVAAPDLAMVYKMNLRKVENTVARLARLARSHCL
jgi:site-specific recombinase XerC